VITIMALGAVGDRDVSRQAKYPIIAAAEIGLKEHDRLALAKTLMERSCRGGGHHQNCRSSSSW
jgi:hypothetical protein